MLPAAAVFPSGKVTQPEPVYRAAEGLRMSHHCIPEQARRAWRGRVLPCKPVPAPAHAEAAEVAAGSTQSLGRGPVFPTCECSREARIRKLPVLSVFPCHLSL